MNVLVLTSGGVDSTTCLGMAVDQYGREHVAALSMSYGQKHVKEMESAKAVADYYGLELHTMDLAQIFCFSNSSLLQHSSEEIPKESYAVQLHKTEGSPVSTYVPFRNGLFLSTAASVALSMDCSLIYYGAHKDDAAGNAYPDCSERFYQAMNQAVYEGSGHLVRIEAPFINKNKAEIVKTGLELDVPYHLTWSCYEGNDRPCGVCGTCIDRKLAFEQNGVVDPLLEHI